MKKTILYILLGFLSFLGHADNPADLVKNSTEQIDFLYARNKAIEEGKVDDKKWFIYFIGSDQPTLREYLLGIDTTNNYAFSTNYLDNLNNLLIEINKLDKVAMYVAVSDYNNPITVPLIPEGNTIEEKIASLKKLLDDPDGYTNITKDHSVIDLENGLKDYERFQAFFYEKTNEIFNNSVLSKIESDTDKRVIMPFSVYHYITRNNQKYKYHTFTLKVSKSDKEADDVVKEMKSLISGLTGKTFSEQKIESYVRAYLDHYSGNTAVVINPGGIETTINKDGELYKRAYGQTGGAIDKDWSATSQLLDFSGMLTAADKKEFLEDIDFSRTLFKNMKMYVVLTDANTSANILHNLNTLKPKEDQYYIWLHLKEDGTLSLNNIVPKNFDTKIAFATAHWTEVMWANTALNLGEGTVAHLKINMMVSHQLLTYASDILAVTTVPEKYWNPEHEDYPDYMPYMASAFNVTMGDFGSVLNTQQAQMQFAFKTGIWNGIIGEVKGLPDVGILATEYFLSPEKARAFDEGLSQLTFASAWVSFKEAHGYEENKETNDFKLSHQFGKDIVFVASFFVGVGEVSSLAKMGKFNKIASLTKISEGITNGVIKVLKKMPQHLSGALKKLPDNIVKEVQRAGTKSYLILKLNTTRLAKISDDALFSEMKLLQEGAVIKLTDGSDAIFENIRYLDDLGEKTGTITIVKNGDELGFRILGKGVVNNIDDFAKLSKAQKLSYIEDAWKAYYPQIFFERKLFEDMMGKYRYLKTSGWGHTDEIASNFKAIDFYKDFTKIENEIIASKVVSMKTTTTTNVDNWLKSNPIKNNLNNLVEYKGLDNGISWNGTTIKYSNAEVHIYMKKVNITPELETEWLNKLAIEQPNIQFEIKALEDFIK